MSAQPETPSPVRSRRTGAALVSAVLLAYVAVNLAVAGQTSITVDEVHHFDYGRRVLNGQPERRAVYDNSKMPVSALNALPSAVAATLPPGQLKSLLEGNSAARVATIAASAVLGLLVWRWSRELYGSIAGAVSLGLYVLDPNLLAHSHLVTTDVPFALALFATSHAVWRAAEEPHWRKALIAGGALGLAQITKLFALLLYPLVALLALARARFGPRAPDSGSAASSLFARGLLLVVASVTVIHLGFGFDHAFSRLESFKLWSTPMQRLASTPVVGRIPVPLPDAYVSGLDMALHAEREKANYGRVYLLGELHDRGVPGYFLVASLFKVPLPALLLGVVLLFSLPRIVRRESFWRDEVYLLVPSGAYAIYLNFFYDAQIGIRHFLLVFPFAYTLAGSLFRDGLPTSRARRVGLVLLASWQLASVALAYPHYIPYFNELVPDRKLAYRVLSDSNVDWGQAADLLRRWLERNPRAILYPAEPIAGRVVVGASALTGVVEGEKFAWLRRLTPVDHVGYSYLVFDVSEEFAAAARRDRPAR